MSNVPGDGGSILAITVLLAIVALLVLAGGVGSTEPGGIASAQQPQEEAGGDEGGLEAQIEGFIESGGLLRGIAVLLGGVFLLTACAEKLISYLTRASLGLRISLFALAIVFTGFEVDDMMVAVVFSAGNLEGAALGTALGTALAITGITLALAAIVQPFSVAIPRDYVALFALSPLLVVPFAAVGTLSPVHGIVLIGLFIAVFSYLVVREYQRDIPVFRTTELGAEIRPDGGTPLPASVSEIPEDRLLGRFATSGWVWVGLSFLALAGIVFASMLLEAGSEVVIDDVGLNETVYGATILTLILTFEDIMLTIEPIRRGVPEIGIGNVIGSVLFSVTANIGVILMFSDLTISSSVLTLHLPAIIIVTALAAYFLSTGKLKRWHGYLLGGLYVTYWAIAVFVYGGVPVSG
ncbi:sodium:calcium antiporter [Halomarina rubra]|uniref:Sodium:calcium antiporter n=1 Tax=Halomarina rubra TaxID=2071873 RepID=A0ABD6AXP1_9EURY|nr:sodium:proton exchanger [Halomarina rubra]